MEYIRKHCNFKVTPIDSEDGKNIIENKFLVNPLKSSIIWTEKDLPPTKYIKNKDPKRLQKLEEKLAKFNQELNYNKIVKILTVIELEIINSIKVEDLLEYDGSTESFSIKHAININKGTFNWICLEYDETFIFKLLKKASLLKNYNLMNILIKCLQTKKLSNKMIEKLLFYKEMLQNQNLGIFPFEWLLRDCMTSNLNVESAIASMRFCKIIEILNMIKNIKVDYEIKESHKHFVYSNIWRNLDVRVGYQQEEDDYLENLHLHL